MSSLRTKTAIAVILLLALGLRIAATVVWRSDLGNDPDAYFGLAERLAAGDGFVTPDGRPTAFRPPLYPLLLCAVIWAGTIGVAALQVGLGVATVGLTVLAGTRLGLGRWSLLAASLVAVDPLLLRYTPQVMTEVTCAFLTALLMALTVKGRDGGQSVFGDALLGLAFGLATLARPTFWVWGALGGVAWIVYFLLAGRAQRIAWLKQGFVVVVAAGSVVALWGTRNSVVIGRPIITTTHGGYTLLLANNPVFWDEVVDDPDAKFWRGESLDDWQRSLEARMKVEGIAKTDELARDRWFQAQAKKYIRENPGRFVRSVFFRLRRLFDIAPSGGENSTTPRPVVIGTGLFYTVVFFLVILGVMSLLLRVRRMGEGRFRRWLPVLLLIAAYSAVHAIYWTDARMRAPLVPALALLAACGASRSKATIFKEN